MPAHLYIPHKFSCRLQTCNHLDVVTAFLNPHVDDLERYMEIPNEWDRADGDCNCGDGLQQRRQQLRLWHCHCGDCHCGNGDCHSGGCDSGDSDSDYGNGITVRAIIRLNIALYGLKHAPRLWYKDIDGFLRSLGFTQSHADRNLNIYGAAAAIICR